NMLSDREYGDGFADMTVETFGYGLGPRKDSRPCIVMEFKYCGKLDRTKTDKMTAEEYRETKRRLMTESAEDALEQIEKREYARDLTKTHSRILKYGISFYDKEALAILVESEGGKDVRKVSAEKEISLA
ncbi:MAG: PD-(D/E)XK nuclease domain-containing protein, partial [Clostridia bacterium]|nr:PD-(D/E)XK nuclease domain-containing protein [Clostridia bacterium]